MSGRASGITADDSIAGSCQDMECRMEILCQTFLRPIMEIQDSRVFSSFFERHRPVYRGEDDGPAVAGGHTLVNHLSRIQRRHKRIGRGQRMNVFSGEFADLSHRTVTAP